MSVPAHGIYKVFEVDPITGLPVASGALPPAALLADNAALPTAPIVGAVPMLYDGTNLDLERANTEGTLLASAARTAAISSAVQTNHNARGVLVYLSVTNIAVPGTTLLLTIRSSNPSGEVGHFVHASPAAFVPVVGGRYGIMAYPGVVAVAATSDSILAQVSMVLPRSWFASVTPGDANAVTYALGYSLIV